MIAAVVQLAPEHVLRLLVARGLLDHAASLGGDLAADRMTGVVLYDLAVETTAKMASAAAPPQSYPGSGYTTKVAERKQADRDPSVPRVLDDLLASWRECEGDEGVDVTELREARRLHNLRNTVQHEGQIPSSEEVERARARAVEAIRWITRAFFATEFESISRATLIRSASVRLLVDRAESLAKEEEYRDALGALERALRQARAEFRGSPFFAGEKNPWIRQTVQRALGDPYGRSPNSSAIESLGRLLETMGEALERIEDRMEVLALGGDASEYDWFVETAPKTRTTVDDSWEVPDWEPPRTESQYLRGIDFVVRTVLRWEQLPARAQVN
jgi:hypothetical protein